MYKREGQKMRQIIFIKKSEGNLWIEISKKLVKNKIHHIIKDYPLGKRISYDVNNPKILQQGILISN